jgi:hypothetical protein
MKPLVYFDTDTFHHFATTYQDRVLPSELQSRIVFSPITMLEVFTHLVLPTTVENLRGLINWVDKENLRLLPWPEDQVRKALFGLPEEEGWILGAVEVVLNRCLRGSPEDICDDAAQLQDRIVLFKAQKAGNFPQLVSLCRQHPRFVDGFDDQWLRCVIPGLKTGEVKLNGDNHKAQLLVALSAYREFEVAKLKVAISNPQYNSLKHRNDTFDARQLAYLCDANLHFITCDAGYLTKVRKSAQRSRIHQTSQKVLSDPDKTEAMLGAIFGS